MKHLKETFSLAFVLLLLIVPVTMAQFTLDTKALKRDNSGLKIEFKGSLDTLGTTYDTLYSAPFSIDEYDGLTNMEYGYLVSHAGNVKVKVKLLHSYLTQTSTSMVATVLRDSVVTKAELSTYLALAGNLGTYYRLFLCNMTGGRKTTTFDIILNFPKKDVVILPVGGK